MSHREHNIAEEIRGQGFRMTPQRQLVLDVICDHSGHMTANEVIAEIQSRAPIVNSATVYRVLQFLCDLQLVTRTEINGQAVYELALAAPHHHLACRNCGRVMDLPENYFEALAQQLLEDYSFDAELNHLALSGKCADCS
jgi:Fur family ferric uptake transcriptional regulator